MSNRVAQLLDDVTLQQLLIQAWRLGFNASTEQCNGEYPQGLADDGKADVEHLLQTFQSTRQ
ncbi:MULTISPECIES: hypothetical protein [Pseudomonas]|uniref:hypothetical protein n=1 Tax=Pseudomonas TaxID=286 RepID=UPI0010BFBDF3|nr:hypothetical protein [Pseudomonas asiatica]